MIYSVYCQLHSHMQLFYTVNSIIRESISDVAYDLLVYDISPSIWKTQLSESCQLLVSLQQKWFQAPSAALFQEGQDLLFEFRFLFLLSKKAYPKGFVSPSEEDFRTWLGEVVDLWLEAFPTDTSVFFSPLGSVLADDADVHYK